MIFPHWRIHALVSTTLDTGCRIEEALNSRNIDFDESSPDGLRQG